MNYLITRKINLNSIYQGFLLRPCCIEYITKFSNPFYLFILKLPMIKNQLKVKHVKMGREFSNNKKRIAYESIKRYASYVKKIRVNLLARSNNHTFNILVESLLNSKMSDYLNEYSVEIYYESKYSQRNKDLNNIFLYKDSNSRNLFFSLFINTYKYIFFYLIKKFILLLNYFLSTLPDRSHIDILETDNLFISSDILPSNRNDFFYRNQYVLSRNLSKNKDFIILEYNSKKLYSGFKKLNLKKGYLKNFIAALSKELNAKNDYPMEFLNFNLKHILIFTKITYKFWILTENIYPKRVILDSNNIECAALLVISKLRKIPAFIYQYSLLSVMNPGMHSPYANVLFFTEKHAELYLSQSIDIKGSCQKKLKINYPLQAYENKKKNNLVRKKFKDDFKLVIAYFDENFANGTDAHSYLHYFLEDYLSDLKTILSYSKKHPELGIVFKPQFFKFNLLSFIKQDSELMNLYDPRKHIEFIQKSKINLRNVIVPNEIAKVVDLCIVHTVGGTAGYETSLAGTRTVFIDSGHSEYEELLPENVCFSSLEEIFLKIDEISCDRSKLINSELGKFDLKNL